MVDAKPISIYELRSVEIKSNKNPKDGSYETYERSWGIFSTRQKAEALMKRVAYETSSYRRLFAFFIYEKLLDDEMQDQIEDFNSFQSVWSYHFDGSFYCHGYCDEACKKPFRGRPASSIMLKKGDLAWCMMGKRIYPCLVFLTPMTDVEYENRVKAYGHELGMDYSDDCYLVSLYGEEHEHPNTWTLFPYSSPCLGNISRRHLERLLACRNLFLDREEEYIKQKST